MFNDRTTSTGITLALGLGLFLALLWALGSGPPVSHAQGPDGYSTYYVALSCTGVSAPCHTTVQAAVDAVDDPADVIKVAAGTYTDVHGRPRNDITTTGLVTQVVYISKTVSIQGGYTTANWATSYPITQPTTLDAQRQGRVLYITGDISTTVEGLHITGGSPDYTLGSGGGVYVISATVTLRNNWVLSNTVDLFASGAGVYLWHSDATLSGNTIQGNTGAARYGGVGGGVYLGESTATLRDNTVLDNQAMSGGGLYLGASTATLEGNVIEGNGSGGWGNGIGGGIYVSAGSTLLSNNVVRDNVAAGSNSNGGGVYLSDSISTLSGNTIVGNMAVAMYDAAGGGIYVSGGSAVLSGNVIQGNSSTAGLLGLGTEGYGGGLHLAATAATLTNNIIAGNDATTAGSGLYVADSSSRLWHNTIARNVGGAGSGVLVADGSTVTLTNTILVSHTVGIIVTGGSTAALEATLWGAGTWANTTDWGGAGMVITGTPTHNHWGDPAFVHPDAGDYHICEGSAARDTGLDIGVTTDVDGEPRPNGTGYDIGADEFYPNPDLTVAKGASPDPVQAGAPLTFTIYVTNTGNVDLHATVTDTLPTHITPGETPDGTPILPGGTLTWTSVITAPGGVWMETVVVTVEQDYEGLLTNVVEVTTEEGAAGDARVTVNLREIYLPLVLRVYSQ